MNGHANLFWKLRVPVFKPCKQNNYTVNRDPLKWFNNIQYSYTESLQGDHGYNNATMKNPFSEMWYVEWCDEQYSLEELNEYAAHYKPYVSANSADEIFAGRNDEMFHVMRKEAYKMAFKYSAEEFEKQLFAMCEKYNQEDISSNWPEKGPLPRGEVSSIARGIAKWVLHQKDTKGFKQRLKNHGAMNFEKIDESLTDAEKEKVTASRQADGARYTHVQRKNKTEQKIIETINDIKSNNIKMTKNNISKYSGVGLRTLYRYNHLFLSNELTF